MVWMLIAEQRTRGLELGSTGFGGSWSVGLEVTPVALLLIYWLLLLSEIWDRLR
jgi:hypothetical protein